jgi:cell division protein FtsL
MEFLIFIVVLVMIAACSDVYDKYHERQMVKAKHYRETIYD